MSDATTNYTDKFTGVMDQLMEAMISLHMEPNPIANPDGTYLSDTDHNARHAMEHIRAAKRMAESFAIRLDSIESQISKLSHLLV